ncbi:DMT family transporter [Marinobacterium mangrovicola]|uniref:Threonine/homoserine efflux transporter RhtA n=1 Tax=Marinobacterium mangrovicola TaxID=1476959 RepID=A0A4R1GSZ3_9GAMM|nr:DMT family transporter [Marinobacterium mangrovicola]TCK09369.1 threonine/homoserine efflux transporter RhtA [Marinobacterium mangrovicola]
MSSGRLFALVCLAMLAFAGNSLLCRVALRDTDIDPASFTAIRLCSGALTLWLFLLLRSQGRQATGNWPSALALFLYAGLFSYAYTQLEAGAGALLLFGAVQVTMIGYALFQGERFTPLRWLGLGIALAGLIGLLLPGLSAPPLASSLLMAGAGIAWGVYTLRGRTGGSPALASAGNFIRSAPLALLLLGAAWLFGEVEIDTAGVLWALASGALASAVGYLIWYAALPHISATNAATIQLSVPVITAIAGIILLSETLSLRLLLTSVAILGGIALVIRQKPAAT